MLEKAGFYTIEALHETLSGVVDFARINYKHPRLTVGAVNVRSGEMRYFDSRDMPIALQHVLAYGALPPAFPAIRIDGDPYWDGGISSNTPIETVFDDDPRRDTVVFTVQMWHATGPEPVRSGRSSTGKKTCSMPAVSTATSRARSVFISFATSSANSSSDAPDVAPGR